MSASRAERHARLGLAAALAGASAAIAYVGQRLWERVAGGRGADPLLVLHDPRIAFHGRALAASWWGGVAFVLALALTHREVGRARAVALLRHGAVPLVLLLALLAYRWP